MTIALGTPDTEGLGAAADALRDWQAEGAPMQLHPGDLGWYGRTGPRATAEAVRTWSRAGRILAVGLLDGPGLLRLAIAPGAQHDEDLARRVADDAARPERGVLAAGEASVEAPVGALVDDRLRDHGWRTDEPWTLLRRDLAAPVQEPGVRVEEVGPSEAPGWAEVLRSSFGASTPAPERWHALASGLPYDDARCLVAYDRAESGTGAAVAVVGVWSAGPGRPGLIEPMGVHADHRGRGHGRAITLAGARALREMGASSVLVATTASNVGGVATYESAGFERLPERRDRRRDA